MRPGEAMSISVAPTPEPLPPALAPPVTPSAASGQATRARDGASAFGALLQRLAGEIREGESLTRSALGAAGAGHAIGPAELIALQAGIYRYGEAVDLASRLVDRATGAVKTVLQGA
jgi:hypothetical protein